MIKRRYRHKQSLTLEQRLEADTKLAREAAHKLPPGPEREALVKRALRNNAAAGMCGLLASHSLRVPT